MFHHDWSTCLYFSFQLSPWNVQFSVDDWAQLNEFSIRLHIYFCTDFLLCHLTWVECHIHLMVYFYFRLNQGTATIWAFESSFLDGTFDRQYVGWNRTEHQKIATDCKVFSRKKSICHHLWGEIVCFELKFIKNAKSCWSFIEASVHLIE